jgi:hypothetical protein
MALSPPLERRFGWIKVILKAVIEAKLYGKLYFGFSSRQPARNEYSLPISKSILADPHHVCFILERWDIGCLDVCFRNHLDSCESVLWWGRKSCCRILFKRDSRDFGTFNYVIYRVSRVRYECPAYSVLNAPTLEEIRREMNEKWAWQSGSSNCFLLTIFR